jgi:hypothetical protein
LCHDNHGQQYRARVSLCPFIYFRDAGDGTLAH